MSSGEAWNPDEDGRRQAPSDTLSPRQSTNALPDDDMDELDEDEDETRSVATSSESGAKNADSSHGNSSASALASTSAATLDGPAEVVVPHKTQAAFVHKLWSMLRSPSLNHLISWTNDGKAFTVFHPTEFARSVLPQFFKHSNFASFIRQLNMYSFAKVNDALGTTIIHTDSGGSQIQAWEFQNTCFQRDRPDLLASIKRKSAKGASGPSPAPSRRRSSIVRSGSSKSSSRRDVAADQAGGSSRDGTGAAEQDARTTALGLAGLTAPTSFPTTRIPVPAEPGAPSGRRIAPGLADFAPAPYAGEGRSGPSRVKEELADPPPMRSGSPPLYSRPSAAHTSYPPSNPISSPRSRSQPFPSPSYFYQPPRSGLGDDTLPRQLQTLEGQVRSLSDALYQSQREYIAWRTASHSVLEMLLGIVADMDTTDQRKDEIESCSAMLAKLHPDLSAIAAAHGSLPYQFPGAQSTWPSHSFTGYAPYSPRPSTTGSVNIPYSRAPTAESYTRSSRSDFRAPDPQPPPFSASHPSFAFRSSATTQDPLSVPPPAPLRLASASAPPLSSGMPAAYNKQSYPSPMLGSWPSSAQGRPTTLPSLSSLLEGVPANGDRRTLEEGGVDSAEERARKKLRQ
ncbi:hypothetical protein JCM21900_005487 [Sporobolomyces salmonicolor]